MISESGSESSTTMSSASLFTSKTKEQTDDAIKRKKKKKRAVAKVDDLNDTDHKHIKPTKKCKETKQDNGDVAHLPVKKKSSIKSDIIDSKSHHSKSKDPKRIIGESSDKREKRSIKSESRNKKSAVKLQNGVSQKDKSLRSSSSKTKEKKRYEEIEIDGITINAFRTWEDLQDELNDRISASITRNATISATNCSINRSLDSELSRAHTSNDSSLGTNGGLSYDSHEPSSSGLMKSPTSLDTQGLPKNLNDPYLNERNLDDRCNTNINESIGQANTSTGANKFEPRLNELLLQTRCSNQNISDNHQEHNNDNQNHQHRHHHRHHHDSKHPRLHTRDELRTDERVRQQQQHHQHNQLHHHQVAPPGPPAFERAILDFKRQQQNQMDFFGQPPSPPQPSPHVPPPAPLPASHTAHQYFQQYHQLYQHMQNSAQHSLSHQQPPLPPPPPLPFPQTHHPPLHHQQNPYMQSFIDHHHQQQQQHKHLHHHMPPAPPSLPSPYMSPFTITDTIHTISRQTIIPPPMMPPPPALPSLPGLEQLSVASRYGMGSGPGRMSAIEHSHLTSHQPPSYMPSPTERSFMEFARSYANATNLSSNYSSHVNQTPLTKGPPTSASLYGQLDRISQKSELHHAFGSAGMGPYPGAYPGPGGRPPTSAWQLPGW